MDDKRDWATRGVKTKQTDTEKLDVMTQTKRFPALREEIKKIGESLAGLVKEEPAADAWTPPAAAPAEGAPPAGE